MGRARRKGSRLAARQQSSLGHVMLNALSVDVEDWFQVGAFESTIKRDDWDGLNHRVERNSNAVLALLEEAGVKATFFTLGWVEERSEEPGGGKEGVSTVRYRRSPYPY